MLWYWQDIWKSQESAQIQSAIDSDKANLHTIVQFQLLLLYCHAPIISAPLCLLNDYQSHNRHLYLYSSICILTSTVGLQLGFCCGSDFQLHFHAFNRDTFLLFEYFLFLWALYFLQWSNAFLKLITVFTGALLQTLCCVTSQKRLAVIYQFIHNNP